MSQALPVLRHVATYIYICIHIYIHIYLYTYIYVYVAGAASLAPCSTLIRHPPAPVDSIVALCVWQHTIANALPPGLKAPNADCDASAIHGVMHGVTLLGDAAAGFN